MYSRRKKPQTWGKLFRWKTVTRNCTRPPAPRSAPCVAQVTRARQHRAAPSGGRAAAAREAGVRARAGAPRVEDGPHASGASIASAGAPDCGTRGGRRRSRLRARVQRQPRGGAAHGAPPVAACVDTNQCVGSSGEEPASPRHRAGVASMASKLTGKSTRRTFDFHPGAARRHGAVARQAHTSNLSKMRSASRACELAQVVEPAAARARGRAARPRSGSTGSRGSRRSGRRRRARVRDRATISAKNDAASARPGAGGRRAAASRTRLGRAARRGAQVEEPDACCATRRRAGCALDRVEARRRDDLRQVLHVRRLRVDDVAAPIRHVQPPEVDPQVVRGQARRRRTRSASGRGVARAYVAALGPGCGAPPTRRGTRSSS